VLEQKCLALCRLEPGQRTLDRVSQLGVVRRALDLRTGTASSAGRFA
jgi:hypothetical protein